MGPKRPRSISRSRTELDDNLPENWSVATLKAKLTERGIVFSPQAKRARLIKIYKDDLEFSSVRRNNELDVNVATGSTFNVRTDSSAERPGRILRQASTQNASGGDQHGGLHDVVAGLLSTVNTLQQSADTLAASVQKNNRSLPAAAGSALQLHTTAGTSTESSSGTVQDRQRNAETEQAVPNYNLQTARESHFGQSNSNTGVSVHSPGSFVRTQYGYSAETLPFVETISPKIRRDIITDGQIPPVSPRGRAEPHPLHSSSGVNGHLTSLAHILLLDSISPATSRTYVCAYQLFLQFMVLCGVGVKSGHVPVVTEDTLIHFVTYCHQYLALQYSTIKLYLAGIRFHYLQAGSNCVELFNTERLYQVLKGIKRRQSSGNNQGSNSRSRMPITFELLSRISGLLKKGVFSPVIDSMLLAVCQMAFFGFLRCGEFTVRQFASVRDTVKMGDIIVAEDKSFYTLLLRTSKTDPFRKGVSIHIFNSAPLFPVHNMIAYLDIRGKQGANSDSPAFSDGYNVLTRDCFISYVRHLIAMLNLDQSKYCGHSFRIGAATSAAASGLEDHLIQALGRWSSDCYIRYIHINRQSIFHAQTKMCTS